MPVVFFFWIDDANNFALRRPFADDIEQLFVNDPFAVIGNDDAIVAADSGANKLAQLLARRRAGRLAAFTIETDNLLVARAGDDAGFLNRRHRAVDAHASDGGADLAQRRNHTLAAIVLANDTACGYSPAERTNIMNHVGGTAQAGAFRQYAHHGHWRFG